MKWNDICICLFCHPPFPNSSHPLSQLVRLSSFSTENKLIKADQFNCVKKSPICCMQQCCVLIDDLYYVTGTTFNRYWENQQVLTSYHNDDVLWLFFCPLQAILAGDFVLSVSSQMLARIRNEEVLLVLSQVIEDLVRGRWISSLFELTWGTDSANCES